MSKFGILTDGWKIQSRKRLLYNPHSGIPLIDYRRLLKLRTPFSKIIFLDSHILSPIAEGFAPTSIVLILNSLTGSFDYERYGVPCRYGDRWYYTYNEGLKPQNVYYALDSDAIDSNEKGTIFFDPNTLSDDGTLAVLHLQINVNLIGEHRCVFQRWALPTVFISNLVPSTLMDFPNLDPIGVMLGFAKLQPEKIILRNLSGSNTQASLSHTIIKDCSTSVTRNLWVSTTPEPKLDLTEMPWHVITRNIAYSSCIIMFLEQNNPRIS